MKDIASRSALILTIPVLALSDAAVALETKNDILNKIDELGFQVRVEEEMDAVSALEALVEEVRKLGLSISIVGGEGDSVFDLKQPPTTLALQADDDVDMTEI